jgi:3-hydroxyisobutyrate dehydrogenase
MSLVRLNLPDDEPDLAAILENVWYLLDKGVRQRKHGFHLPTVATFDPATGPTCRTVVLRGVDRGARRLRFHTDARSAKVAQIQREPRIGLTFYDVSDETQVRVQARAHVHFADASAEAAWEATRPFSRRCYLAENAPGAATEAPTSGLPDWAVDATPTAEQSEAGRENFAIVLCDIVSFDWMFLSHRGHRRARFVWDDSGALHWEWAQP